MKYGLVWNMGSCEIWARVKYGLVWNMGSCEIWARVKYYGLVRVNY